MLLHFLLLSKRMMGHYDVYELGSVSIQSMMPLFYYCISLIAAKSLSHPLSCRSFACI